MRVDPGYEMPLYTIKHYGGDLYRVVKRLGSNTVSCEEPRHEEQQDSQMHLGKFESALSRAKNTCREYCLCNNWDFFVTFTFDKDKWDRYAVKERIRELMQYIQNLNKTGYNIKYVLVPELHEDGAIHFHGFMSGIPSAPRPEWWPETVNLNKKTGAYYDHCPLFSDRYGWSAVTPIRDPMACGFYVSKYICKDQSQFCTMAGFHLYYHSRGLSRAKVCGYSYRPDSRLDMALKYENHFYKFGFCRISQFDQLVNVVDEFVLDEDKDMFCSWVVSDPVTAEVLAIVGGDDEDPMIQEVIQGYELAGWRCSVQAFE